MQKSYDGANNLDQLFSATASENPLNAQVAENLSGTAQQLKSASHALAYKNLLGDKVDDHTAVQDAHVRNVQADWTDTHDSGVTSNVIETAPSINQNTALAQSHSTTTSSLNANINTTNDAHSINTPQWESYHKNLETSIPTNLQSTIATTGSASTGHLQSQVGAQNANTASYAHNFGGLTTNGNASVSGTGSVNGSNINIGPGGNSANIDFTLQRDAGKYFPTVTGQVFTKNLPLGVFKTGGCLVTGQIDLDIDLTAQSKTSVDPLSFDRDGLSEELSQTVNNYFANMDINSVVGVDGLPKTPPTVEISYANGQFEFSNAVSIQGATDNPDNVGTLFVITYNNTTIAPIKERDYQDWMLQMNTTATLTIKVYPAPSASAPNTSPGVMAKATADLQAMKQRFSAWWSREVSAPSSSTGMSSNQLLNDEQADDQALQSQGDLPADPTTQAEYGAAGGMMLFPIEGQPFILRVGGIALDAGLIFFK